jgi:hypothetical protein
MTHALAMSSPNAAAVPPPLIRGAGAQVAWCFIEFFTVNIRNRHTRAAYVRAAAVFLGWCEERGIDRLPDARHADLN